MRDPAHCGDRVEERSAFRPRRHVARFYAGSVSTSHRGPSAHCIRVPPSVSSSRTRRTRARSPATVVSTPCGPGRRAATPQCQHPAVHIRGGLGPVDLGVLRLEETGVARAFGRLGITWIVGLDPCERVGQQRGEEAEHPPEDVLWPLGVVDRRCPLGEQTAGVEVAVDAIDAVAKLAVAVAYRPADRVGAAVAREQGGMRVENPQARDAKRVDGISSGNVALIATSASSAASSGPILEGDPATSTSTPAVACSAIAPSVSAR